MFVPIAKTSVDWSLLLEAARKATSRSVTASVDQHRVAQSELATFLCVLAEFSRMDGDALTQLRSDGLVRRHVTYGFLVNLPRAEFILLSGYGLSVTPADTGDFAIVSGRMSEWVQAVVEGTQVAALRMFSCLLLAWFEREGMGECWACWDKEDVPSGYYRLVKK